MEHGSLHIRKAPDAFLESVLVNLRKHMRTANANGQKADPAAGSGGNPTKAWKATAHEVVSRLRQVPRSPLVPVTRPPLKPTPQGKDARMPQSNHETGRTQPLFCSTSAEESLGSSRYNLDSRCERSTTSESLPQHLTCGCCAPGSNLQKPKAA